MLCPIPTTIFILLFLFFFTSHSSLQPLLSSPNPRCPPSHCGNLQIKYPFRLTSDPTFCSYPETDFQLQCHTNQTILNLTRFNIWYYVKQINYENYTMWLVDPGINGIVDDVSSCPLFSIFRGSLMPFEKFFSLRVFFIHCLSPVSTKKYIKAPFCGLNTTTTTMFGNFSTQFHSYVMVGYYYYLADLELEESCTVDRVVYMDLPTTKNYTSLLDIYNDLGYGFQVFYDSLKFEECEWLYEEFRFWRNTYNNGIHYFLVKHCCRNLLYANSGSPWTCKDYSVIVTVAIYVASTVVGVIILRLVIGFPLLIWWVVRKWRRRHLCMDKTIEEFLQGQQNLPPIQYTYSDIKKMTNNFMQRLGEGGFGTVYKGKLRSGPSVAIKMMEQSVATENEFISEVATIDRIHHTSIVQLIGFCVERSKRALVYEFLPNGSLDRYIFNQESLDVIALSYDKLFEIAMGVARGIHYLHHGCNMQILHFDIKPHNILLDENFNPKISDFGLAQLRPADESFINLTAARGTTGYMAPEMFYRNYKGITYKADVYSFGMMLMEMASKRKNAIPLIEDESQMHFPSWAYNQLCAGKDIEIEDASEEEMKIVKRIIIVALWCIQMRPSSRPPMNKVIEMLESEFEPQMPPKPFVAPNEMAADHGIARTYSVEYVALN